MGAVDFCSREVATCALLEISALRLTFAMGLALADTAETARVP
jgi:hypothetical protein